MKHTGANIMNPIDSTHNIVAINLNIHAITHLTKPKFIEAIRDSEKHNFGIEGKAQSCMHRPLKQLLVLTCMGQLFQLFQFVQWIDRLTIDHHRPRGSKRKDIISQE